MMGNGAAGSASLPALSLHVLSSEPNTKTSGKYERLAAEEVDLAGPQELGELIEGEAGWTPGGITFEEDAAGGLGRHLGVVSCTLLIVGKIIGVGIFSTPSSILAGVGSVGASLILWAVGFFVSLCGLCVWLELGTMFPRSGGEKVYLEAVYRRPRYLATVMFAMNALVLGFSAAGCMVFAENFLVTVGYHSPSQWLVRTIALGVIIFATLLHGLTPRLGVILMNAVTFFKIFILLVVVVTGWAVLGGFTRVPDPGASFQNMFQGSSTSSNDYATAMFKVINTYGGWSNVNYVMNNVKDPVRTLKIAGPLGLGLCAVCYAFANIAYLSACTPEQIKHSGVTVASLFFRNVFGEQAQRVLTLFVALSALGNVITATFGSGRVNQELAKEGVPLPFGNKFWASNWPNQGPLPGLILHLIPSALVILGPPADVAYPFILDIQGYPSQIIFLCVVLGLFWLRFKEPDAPRPFKVWLPLAFIFLVNACFLLVAPFVPPANGVGDTPPIPYFVYPFVGIGVLCIGALIWTAWRVVLPKMFNYELVPHKETLGDGTVVTVFSKVKRQSTATADYRYEGIGGEEDIESPVAKLGDISRYDVELSEVSNGRPEDLGGKEDT